MNLLNLINVIPSAFDYFNIFSLFSNEKSLKYFGTAELSLVYSEDTLHNFFYL